MFSKDGHGYDNGFVGMSPNWKPSDDYKKDPLKTAKHEAANYMMLLGKERIENEKLRAENARLRNALQWYAHWLPTEFEMFEPQKVRLNADKYTERARAALEGR